MYSIFSVFVKQKQGKMVRIFKTFYITNPTALSYKTITIYIENVIVL